MRKYVRTTNSLRSEEDTVTNLLTEADFRVREARGRRGHRGARGRPGAAQGAAPGARAVSAP